MILLPYVNCSFRVIFASKNQLIKKQGLGKKKQRRNMLQSTTYSRYYKKQNSKKGRIRNLQHIFNSAFLVQPYQIYMYITIFLQGIIGDSVQFVSERNLPQTLPSCHQDYLRNCKTFVPLRLTLIKWFMSLCITPLST